MAFVFAAADIGSNTAHLLVAATDGQLVMRLDNVNEWISLGEEVARNGSVSKDRIEELVAAIREFKKVASNRRAKEIYVFATEAMRSASNHKAVLKRIHDETGIQVELISPRREAEYSYSGAMLDAGGISANLMFEVGGGSAQIAAISGGALTDEFSLPLGTGRVIAETSLAYPCPPDVLRNARSYIARAIESCDLTIKTTSAIASGGVARGLWRAVHPDGEKALEREELDYIIWSVQRLPIPRIIERFNVKAKRATTLLPGALIYTALMDRFGLQSLILSEFGVREGAVLEMARGSVRGLAL